MDADDVICHIQEDLKAITEEGTGPTLSFSYGIVDFTMFDSVDAAIAAADSFMYYNKNSKR